MKKISFIFLLIFVCFTFSCKTVDDKNINFDVKINSEKEVIEIYPVFKNSSVSKGVIISFTSSELNLDDFDLKLDQEKTFYELSLDKITQNEFYLRNYYLDTTTSYDKVVKINLIDYVKEINDFSKKILDRDNYITEMVISLDTKTPFAATNDERFSVKASNSKDYNYIYVDFEVKNGYKLFSLAKVIINDEMAKESLEVSSDNLSARIKIKDPNWSDIY